MYESSGRIGKDIRWYVDDNCDLHVEGSGTVPSEANAVFGGRGCRDLIIHEGITVLGKEAFKEIFYRRVILPDSLRELRDLCLSPIGGCHKLVEIPSGVTFVGEGIVGADPCGVRRLVVPTGIRHLTYATFYQRACPPDETWLTGKLPDEWVRWALSWLLYPSDEVRIFYPDDWTPFLRPAWFEEMREKARLATPDQFEWGLPDDGKWQKEELQYAVARTLEMLDDWERGSGGDFIMRPYPAGTKPWLDLFLQEYPEDAAP